MSINKDPDERNKHLVDFSATKEMVLQNSIDEKDRQTRNIKVRQGKQFSLAKYECIGDEKHEHKSRA